jgi:hypothetical protein
LQLLQSNLKSIELFSIAVCANSNISGAYGYTVQ